MLLLLAFKVLRELIKSSAKSLFHHRSHSIKLLVLLQLR